MHNHQNFKALDSIAGQLKQVIANPDILRRLNALERNRRTNQRFQSQKFSQLAQTRLDFDLFGPDIVELVAEHYPDLAAVAQNYHDKYREMVDDYARKRREKDRQIDESIKAFADQALHNKAGRQLTV